MARYCSRHGMGALAGGHALLLYFALAFAGFWTCLALAPVAPMLPFLGALSPGVAAVVVSGLSEGEAGIRALRRRLVEWRVGIQWYLAALGLPVVEGLLAIVIATALGSAMARRIGPLIPEMWVMYVFAACEELGWRGYALPRLLAQHKPVTASLILGTVHAAWHAPLFLAGQPLASMPVAPYWAWVASQSILMTWILRRARGSVLMAALLHGTSNLTLLVYQGIDRAWTPWLRASIAIAMALTVDVLDARLRRREPSMAAA
jgi:CAAX protease family protein